MSSGSNAPRKQNVAAASAGTSSLYKASSRFLHSGERNHGPAGGAGSKGMKRQRGSGTSLDSEESTNITTEVSRCFPLEKESSSGGGVKSKKRFVGVRQRPSGRWVAEIKDTTQKIRLWLGTFDSAEEGAKAYDSAARALRGANTRTNFVPAMACDSGNVPATKAARLIQLRQIAAASKACEKEAARNAVAMSSPELQKGAVDHPPYLKVESSQTVNHHSPLMRQDFQQSISSLDPLPRSPDDHTIVPHLPSSSSPSPKPARLLGRRHNAPLACAKPELCPPFDDHGSNGPKKLELVDASRDASRDVSSPPPKQLEPQSSITSENLSNAITHSLTAGSPQESSSSPGSLRVPSPRSPFECMQPKSGVQSFMNATDHLKSFNQERFSPPPLESFPAFPVENFVSPSPIPFHMPPLEASQQQSLRSDLVGYPHSCATNRDMYAIPSEKDHQEVICRGRSLRSSLGHDDDDDDDDDDDADAMNLDDAKHNCETKCGRASKVEDQSMEYPGSENMYRTELAERKHDGCILREREFVVPELVVPELVPPEIPWPDYVLMDEMGMGTGLLGLHLSCEHSGVYTSAFDFSAEAIDRDSCTSGVLLEEDDSKFFRMQYEQSGTPPASQDFQECVLLTEPPELDYSLSSPHESSLPGPQLSPQETTHMSSSLLWRLDDTTTTAWDGQSSGSTESTTDGIKPQAGDGGECTSSQDHEALWSSMDLPPLCMVA